MDERPSPPPEGRLISEALAVTGMSIRQASRRAGISYGRWRQITTGYQTVSAGSYARVHAPAKTVARMAAVAGVTPDSLEEAGRADAAAELRVILSREASAAEAAPDPDGPLTLTEQRMVTAFIKAIRTGAEESDGTNNGT